MEKSWGLIGVILAFAVFELCNGLPMDLLSHHDGPNAQLIGVLVGVMVSVCVVIAFVGCVCCQRRQGFKVFRDSPVSASVINETSLSGDDPGHVNPIANPEFTIFTPLSPPHHNNNVFRSQPVISYNQNENVPELPNKLVSPITDGIDVSSWFDGSQPDFPRSKLKYIRELGNGWFGRVVEGEAQEELTGDTENGWTPVAVRILESSASAREQALFLHEANMYRFNEPPHPNIIRLFGRSLEATPLLLIQEFCPKGDLKNFLLKNRSSSTSSSVMAVMPLKCCCQLASAVQFLHEKNMPHLDLAARTCQLTSDLNVKLGDYGLAVSQFPHDYYQGTPAIPVRWCAPETLNYTNTTLQPKQVTCEGNIWSLGVTMWEICEWGNQPYENLTDDEVISQVMGAPNIRLPVPSLNVYYTQPLYRLMQHCWQSSESRPQISQIHSMLMHLLQQYQQNKASNSPSRLPNFPMEDFDSRWDTFKPNTIVKTDNHVSTLSVPQSSDKMTDVSSVSSSEIFVNPEKQKSPSLTNLHGSLENLVESEEAAAATPVQNMDSWLQNVANHTSDMQYVRGLSQAIQALDSALAAEQTSSSGSSFERSPAPESLETSQDHLKLEFKLNQDESTNLMDSIMYRRTDSGSETEDETWKRRIERGAYSEKVRQKSKSVADLMILTHIDCSDTDSETPQQSLEYRKNVRCKPSTSLENSILMFGSEGNLLEVQDTFQEELRKLQEERRDSLLFVPATHSSQTDIQKTPDTDINDIISFTTSEPVQAPQNITIKQPDKHISTISDSVNKTVPPEHSDLFQIIDDQIKTELGNVKTDTKDDNQNKVFCEVLSVSEQQSIPETDDIMIEENIDNKTSKTDDTLIRQQVSNLIDEISFEAEEQVYERNNRKNEHSESQDAIQKEDTMTVLNCDNQVKSDIKHKVESFLQAEIEHNNFKAEVILESPESNSFTLNDEQIDFPKNVKSEGVNDPKELIEKVELVINLTENITPVEDDVVPQLLDLQELKSEAEIVETVNRTLVKSPEPSADETFTLSEEKLQELHNVDNRNKPVAISNNIISCTKEDYSLVQNFINNERNGPFVELDKILDNSSNIKDETSVIPANLLDLHEPPSNTQVYNVYSVQIDHKPPPEVFDDSPIKNFYAKPFNETELITAISPLGLILESETKSLQKLNSVCSSSLPNEHQHIFSVLNTPPLINGFDDGDLSKKIKVNLKDENKILRENCQRKLDDKFIKNGIIHATMTNSQETNIHQDVHRKEDSENNITFHASNVTQLNDDLMQNNNDVTYEIINSNDANASCSSPKKLSDLASDILLQHCLYMNENCEMKRSNSILSDSHNNSSNEACYNPRKLSDIILESLTNNPEYKNDSVISNIKNETLNKEELKSDVNIVTSTPFKTLSKNIEDKDSLSENNRLFSFVSEGDEASDSQTTVILGPCEDYTLGLYSGLKTTFEPYYDDDRPEEEILQFSSNFMPLTDESILNESQYFPNRQSDLDAANATVDFSLETWDRFLGKTLQDHDNGPASIFDHDNFTPRSDNLDVFNNKSSAEITDDTIKEQNQTFDLPNGNNRTFILDEKLATNDQTFNIDEKNTKVSVNKPFTKQELEQLRQQQQEEEENNQTFNIDEENTEIAGNKTFTKQELEKQRQHQEQEEEEKNNKNRTFVLDEMEEGDVPNIDDTETAVLNSWEPGEGWFLHPQVPPESLTGDIDISGSDNTDENSYVRFTLDEECVNALRNELAAKLPHAQGSSHEEEQLEPEEWDAEERNEVIVKYSVYATPLSPIPEESCCEDAYCDQTQHREGSDSDSDWSEPGLGRTSQLEDILVVDTETHTAQLLESPSLREPQHRHTPSQDSCCSNDTLFNLEDLNYGLIDNESPLHQGFNHVGHHHNCDLLNEKDMLEIEIIAECDTPKQESPSKTYDIESPVQQSNDINSDSIELNLTYTKPDINIDDISENDDNSNKENTTITINSSPAIIEDPVDVKPSNRLELKLDPGTFGVAPLPSPEDIPWKQIPASLLTYDEMMHSQNDNHLTSEETTKTIQDNNEYEEEDDDVFHDNDDDNEATKESVKLDEDLSDSQKESTVDADLYSNLTDIRFSGPCDAQLMSTSFSESVDYADERDWDSGSDTRSSSSGEFIWKEGEHEESLRALHAASHDVGVTEDINPMDAIVEENSSEDSDDCEEDMEETEFVPSAWDAQATPTKSALRSPEKSSKQKHQQKGVSFKKQKYHCVYEYPREPESPVQPTNDLWRPLSDFPNFADWELDPDACVPHYDDNPLDCRDGPYDPVLDRFIPKTNYSNISSGRDLYQLNPFPDPNTTGIPPPTEDDFFISSSTRPFQSSSQFFPGQTPRSKFIWQDYQSSSSQSSRDLSDNMTPDSGIDDVTPASLTGGPNLNDVAPLSPPKNKVHSLKYLAALAEKKNSANAVKTQEALGGLRHTRNRLKLDLPPSPNSFTSNRTFSIETSDDPVMNREVPTFTTFGKTRFSVQHVPTPTEDSDSSSSTGKPKTKNVSFEALPHKPHMQPVNTVYIVNKPEESDTQKPVVESVQGEASLLDSADEDSGIESSANATLERREQQILN